MAIEIHGRQGEYTMKDFQIGDLHIIRRPLYYILHCSFITDINLRGRPIYRQYN